MAEQRIPSVSKDVLASIAAKVATKRAASAPAPGTVAAPAHQPYYEAAAVLSCFDPFSLRPVGAEVPRVPLAAASSGGGEPQTSSTTPLDALLSDSVHIARPEGAQLWSLKPGPRINVLRQLRQDNRIQDALGSNPPRANDPVDQAL